VQSTSVPLNNDPYSVLRNRNFLAYAIGRFIASFGQQMLSVAVMWEIYERTHSPLYCGFVGLTQFIPMVLMTLPAGHVADTRERKGVIMSMQAVVGVASIGLAAISVANVHVGWMFACLVAAGIARTFLWSASASFLPLLVSREEFPKAVMWASSTFHISGVLGPAAGGAIIAFSKSAVPVYVLNGVAALVFLALVWTVRARKQILGNHDFSWKHIVGGFRFVMRTRIISGAITLDLFAVLFGGATALLPQYAKDILHVGPQGLGLLNAAIPAGSLVCALYMAHKPPMEKAGRSLISAVMVFGLATIGFGFSRWFWFSMAMLFICGFADNISVIVRHTLVQLLTPDEMRGRVSAVNNLFIGTSNELGAFESGTVSEYMGPVFSVVSGGAATIVTVIAVAAFWPEIRKFGRLVQAEPAEEPLRESKVEVP
jgi:MFS family permease